MVSYRKDDWRLSLHLKNLTDRAYETRGYSGSAVLPGNPFTLYGAVELSLGR
jgi:outer membrane receptor protein involved in Fe transport